jgi:alkylation response protein AidB-like acyl-CoA dehydrogenase
MAGVLQPDLDPKEAIAVGREVGLAAADTAAEHDADGTFVDEGYAAVRESGYGILAVPTALGGKGHGLIAICRAQAAIARYCASTSLAIAMHQHVVLTMAWRWSRGDEEAGRVLKKVVEEGLILSASGTLNPAMITVEGVPCPGGLVVSGRRRLCSGSPGADALVTAAKITTHEGSEVVTLLVPLRADGVEIMDDWDAMGMRGSGSNGIAMDDVFVPDDDIIHLGRHRPSGDGPAAGNRTQGSVDPSAAGPRRNGIPGVRMPGLHISLAVIASTYLGAATGTKDAAIAQLAGTPRAEVVANQRLAGLMIQEVRTAWWALSGMVGQTTDDTLGSERQMVTTMLGKRQIILNSIHTAELAMEVLGSQSYMKKLSFERVLRDVRAGLTHPLTPELTLNEVGRSALAAPSAPAGI